MTFQAGTYGALNRDGTFRGVLVATAPFVGREGCFLPLVADAQPAFDSATQKLVVGGYVVEATQVRQTWSVVALSAAELDDNADTTEAEQLRQVYTALKNGTGTTAVRQARVERVCAFLLKDYAKRNGLIVS